MGVNGTVGGGGDIALESSFSRMKPGDGLPGNGSPLDQDFALVVYNGSEGGGGGDITLTARARKKQGKTQVRLTWDPADGGDINVLRDGAIIRSLMA